MPTATAGELLLSLDLPGVRVGSWPVEPVRRLPSGIAPLDELLGGGLPRGHLSEIVGGASSGRTALLHAWLAAATRAGEVAAVVDAGDALDPPSLAHSGVQLDRVLWVRPPTPRVALKCAELILAAGGFGLVAVDLGARAARPPRETDERRTNNPPLRSSIAASAWPRLAQVTRRTDTAVIILTTRRMTTSCAAVALTLRQGRARWSDRLFDGLTTNVELSRSRFGAAERLIQLAIGDQRSAIGFLKAWRRERERLSPTRSLGTQSPARSTNIRSHAKVPTGRTVRTDQSDPSVRRVHRRKHSGRLWS